ncbi:hypothetical protein WA158_007341 [Blastocystis sp. Blastoise]
MMYLNWLSLLRSSMVGIESYSPETRTWGQAHCRARFAILKVLMETAPGLVSIHKLSTQHNDVIDDFEIVLNKDLIPTIGKQAMNDYLNKLQGYKSCAMINESRALFNHYTEVDDEFLKLREIVIQQRKPRAIFLQGTLSLSNNNEVNLQYEDTTIDGYLQYIVSLLNNSKVSIEDYLKL